MSHNKHYLASCCLSLLLVCFPEARAHHSHPNHDHGQRVGLSGTITKVHWANPHVYFLLETERGSVRVEWEHVALLAREEVPRELFKPGVQAHVLGSLERHGQPVMALLKQVTLPARGYHWVSHWR